MLHSSWFSVYLYFCSCNSNNQIILPDDDIIYENDGVKVTRIENMDPPQNVYYSWRDFTELEAYGEYDLIISGTVLVVNEVTLECRFMDADVTDYVTLFDVFITSLVYSDSTMLKIGDIISVGVPYSSYRMSESLPSIAEGKNFLFFARDTSRFKNDYYQMSNFVDFWITDPNKVLLEKVGEYYVTDDFFSNYSPPSAMNLARSLGITEATEYNLSNTNSIDADSIMAQIGKNGSSVSKENQQLIIEYLASKMYINSRQLWVNVSGMYITECEDLEIAIAEKAYTMKGVD